MHATIFFILFFCCFRFVFIRFVFVFCFFVLLRVVNYDLSPANHPVCQLKQSPTRQPHDVSNGNNSNTVDRPNYKPPLPLPPADTSPPPLSSLIHRSPNGGYVSLLRQVAVPKSGDVVGRPAAAVRFNSLQRPNRGAATAWQRRDQQFRSMRTAGTGSTDKPVTELPVRRPTVGGDRKDDNNNGGGGGGGVDDDEAKASDRREDAFSAATFPKPAPRTRVPSASVAPPSLARRGTYENLQKLLNSDGNVVGGNKVRTGGQRQLLSYNNNNDNML